MRVKTNPTLIYIASLGIVTALLWSTTCVRTEGTGRSTPPSEAQQSAAFLPASVPSSTPETPPSPAPATTPVAEVQAPTPPPKVRTYKIKEGDTLELIAAQFELKVETIAWSNPDADDTALQINAELRIPAADGLLHTAIEGDTLWDVSSIHGVEVDDVIRANPDISPDALQAGQVIMIPGGQPVRKSNLVASRSATERSEPVQVEPAPQKPAPTTSSLIWPLSGEITEYFGWRTHPVYGTRNYHEGIDIGVPNGTSVAAVASGRVIMAEWYGGYGLTVKIDHGNGLVSRYSHNDSLSVKVGQQVAQGEMIARSGNTGVSTGPHLDFGLYRGGSSVDPLSLLP